MADAARHSSDENGVKVLRLYDGTCVPCKELGLPLPLSSSVSTDLRRPLLVFGHGLNDKKEDDEPALQKALEYLALQDPPPPTLQIPRIVIYDARGHGQSTGWELGGPGQFHWRSLAVDMLQVSSSFQPAGESVLLGGYSMGACSAIWAALLSPRYVRGLVLLSSTTAWELRAGRRGTLLERAKAKSLENPALGELQLGAAHSDLPDKGELRRLSVPTLIVSARDDPTHPAAMAEALADSIQDSTLVLTDSKDDLPQVFAEALASWVRERFTAS